MFCNNGIQGIATVFSVWRQIHATKGATLATIRRRWFPVPEGGLPRRPDDPTKIDEDRCRDLGLQERWQVDFVDQEGKRRHKQFRQKKAADAYLVAARAQVTAGTYTAESTSVTIEKALDLWLDRARAEGLERSTVEGYAAHRDHILAVINRDTKLAKLTQARCEQLRDELMKRHSRPMARKILQSFKSSIRDARRRGLIASNPAAETTIGAARRHRRRLEVGVDVPTPEEVKAMVDAATDLETKALVCLAAFAGLRASEIRGLRWTDIDLGKHPAVTISERADRWGTIGPPKSESSQRRVPLGETTVCAVRAWKLAQPPGRKLVFGTEDDRPPSRNHLQRHLLDPLMAKAGTRNYSIHRLRHYAISTWLRSCGGDFKRVQAWAGHATLALTLDRYGHLLPRTDDYAMIADAERGM
jgi:integrase